MAGGIRGRPAARRPNLPPPFPASSPLPLSLSPRALPLRPPSAAAEGPFFVAALLVAFAVARGRRRPSGFPAWFAVPAFGLVEAACFQVIATVISRGGVAEDIGWARKEVIDTATFLLVHILAPYVRLQLGNMTFSFTWHFHVLLLAVGIPECNFMFGKSQVTTCLSAAACLHMQDGFYGRYLRVYIWSGGDVLISSALDYMFCSNSLLSANRYFIEP
uniref:Uncharacterized protein n=4 Tax=Leersia perrieri TaxID=77586 RepID=A0A0D9VIF2_9ORYZ